MQAKDNSNKMMTPKIHIYFNTIRDVTLINSRTEREEITIKDRYENIQTQVEQFKYMEAILKSKV